MNECEICEQTNKLKIQKARVNNFFIHNHLRKGILLGRLDESWDLTEKIVVDNQENLQDQDRFGGEWRW